MKRERLQAKPRASEVYARREGYQQLVFRVCTRNADIRATQNRRVSTKLLDQQVNYEEVWRWKGIFSPMGSSGSRRYIYISICEFRICKERVAFC